MKTASLLAIDGGGTSTVAWLADECGHVVGRAVSGASNQKAIGPDAARRVLSDAIDRAFVDSGQSPRLLEVACLGLAGFDRPEDRALLEDWSASAGWARRLILVNDGDLVVAAGTPEGWGVAVIAGTGSIAVGRAPDGRTARAGGWGHLIGDEGSAYGVAIAAMRRVARQFDLREPDGSDESLSDEICKAMGILGPEGLVSAIYAPAMDRPRIAAVAPAVVRAAARGSLAAAEILDWTAIELASAACSVAKSLNLPTEELPLALAGGFLLGTESLSLRIDQAMARSGFATIIERVEEPVRGALMLARRALATGKT